MARYSKAPITEALIDLRVQLPAGAEISVLSKIQDGEEARYPDKKSMISLQTHVTGKEGSTSTSTSQEHKGWLFTSADKRFVWQAKLDGFTLSRLAPYDCWDTFIAEARRLWSRYRDEVKPVSVTRVALRYINRIDLPLPLGDFKDYLRTVPEVSPDLPQGLAGFFMQLVIPQEGPNSVLLLNEAIIPPVREGVVSVVLDLDLFREQDIPSEEGALWDLIGQLRVRKNQLFEGCITDATRELFQ